MDNSSDDGFILWHRYFIKANERRSIGAILRIFSVYSYKNILLINLGLHEKLELCYLFSLSVNCRFHLKEGDK